MGSDRVRLLNDEAVVIRNVRLIDGTGGDVVERAHVSVEAGRIATIETGARAERARGSASTIDGDGLTLMPGLIDAHVHLTGQRSSSPFERYLGDQSVALFRAAADARQMLEAGFTSARDCALGSFGPQLRKGISARVIQGPRLGVAHQTISQTGGACDLHALPYDWMKSEEPRGVQADGPWEFVHAVRRNFREGATFTKIMLTRGNLTGPSMWPPREDTTTEELEAAVRTTHALGGLCAAHCIGEEGVGRAVAAGVDTIEHGQMLEPGSSATEHIYAEMAAFGTVLVPTLSIFWWMSQQPGVDSWVSEKATEAFDGQLRSVAQARDAGVTIAAGTDTGSRFGVGENALELELLVRAGLSPMEAIVAGTRHGAKAMGLSDIVGRVAEGWLADLVLVDGAPDVDVSVLRKPGAIAGVLLSPLDR